MDEYKPSEQDAILYKTDPSKNGEDVFYGDRRDIGGARIPVHIDDEPTYALTSLEYKIIREKIPNGMLNNNQSLFLSLGSSFLFSSIVYGLTTPFSIQSNGKDSIKWITIIFFIIFVSLSISTLLAFIFSIFPKRKEQDPFDIVEGKIKKCLGIN